MINKAKEVHKIRESLGNLIASQNDIYRRKEIQPFFKCYGGKAIVYHADSRHMPELQDESIDFVVTSPPYWDLKDYKDKEQIGIKQSFENYLADLGKIFMECFRVLRSGRYISIVIGTRISKSGLHHIPAAILFLMEEFGFLLKKEIIWVKPKGTQGLWQRGTTISLKKTPFPGHININIQHEFILIFQKLGNFQIKESEKLPEDFIKDIAWSVWPIKVSNFKNHPAPFPLELAKRLIRMFTYKGETILDPFLGSGTSVISALNLDRKSIGYEINENYCKLSLEYLKKYSQLDLEI